MTVFKTPDEMMRDNLIVKMLAGSHAYGTNIATSDVDYRGIFVADPVYSRTSLFTVGEVSDASEEDTKIYEIDKFIKLAIDSNPNIVELLWTDMSDVTHTTPAYDLLRAAAPKLLSSKIAFTTSGYALSQLKRIKGHNKWINNPQQVEAPQQIDYVSLTHNFTSSKMFKFDLRDYAYGHRLVPYGGNIFGLYVKDKYSPFNQTTGNLNTDYEGDTHELGMPIAVVRFNKDVYLAAKETWNNYWTWKKNRNVARNELEEKFGYDTKHAMHLVRLLRMGAEALELGKVIVKRPDAEELLSVRNGAWTYEELIKYAEHMDNHIKTVLYPSTSLQRSTDRKYAAQLIMDIQDVVWANK